MFVGLQIKVLMYEGEIGRSKTPNWLRSYYDLILYS
jgi:hypothetical protein